MAAKPRAVETACPAPPASATARDNPARPGYVRNVACNPPGIAALIDARIDTCSPDGVIQGWVRDDTRRAPCHVQILLGGDMIAQAVANRFRGDLLRAGFGHGHYGFHARLRTLPAIGPTAVLLHLPHLGASAPMQITVPPLHWPEPRRVEDLLSDPPGWTAADVLARPDCLDMEAAHAKLGAARFIDAVYRFVFKRWPTRAETRVNTDGLAAGRITPAALLVECLRSRERGDMDPGIASPFDRTFPFSFRIESPNPT
jgi:hypothetical protein